MATDATGRIIPADSSVRARILTRARIAARRFDIRCQRCGHAGDVLFRPYGERTHEGMRLVDWSAPCPGCDTEHALMTRED